MGASNPTRRRPRAVHYAGAAAVVLVLALASGGYHVGRDMAHRDNARAEGQR